MVTCLFMFASVHVHERCGIIAYAVAGLPGAIS
jgi:hypothetical protein